MTPDSLVVWANAIVGGVYGIRTREIPDRQSGGVDRWPNTPLQGTAPILAGLNRIPSGPLGSSVDYQSIMFNRFCFAVCAFEKPEILEPADEIESSTSSLPWKRSAS